MEKPSKIIRTTLGRFFSRKEYRGEGVYVIACYPALGCVYIGISTDVGGRLRQHLGGDGAVGNFLRANMADACGWRLDVLVPPADGGSRWCADAERALVARFNPILNSHLTTRFLE